jgi:hypothetical protein
MQMTSPQHFNPDHYKGILTNPGFRLANLLNDLATLEPQQYRDPHFRAMARLVSALNDDQSLDDLDLNEVVLKTIEGLEAYKEAIHVDVLGQETNEFKVSAVGRVNEFISYLAKHMEIDYTRFANVKPETRVLLASSGFEVKKIPNMTRRERGEIIGNQLGL